MQYKSASKITLDKSAVKSFLELVMVENSMNSFKEMMRALTASVNRHKMH